MFLCSTVRVLSNFNIKTEGHGPWFSIKIHWKWIKSVILIGLYMQRGNVFCPNLTCLRNIKRYNWMPLMGELLFINYSTILWCHDWLLIVLRVFCRWWFKLVWYLYKHAIFYYCVFIFLLSTVFPSHLFAFPVYVLISSVLRWCYL